MNVVEQIYMYFTGQEIFLDFFEYLAVANMTIEEYEEYKKLIDEYLELKERFKALFKALCEV
jgi:hypothetical protein